MICSLKQIVTKSWLLARWVQSKKAMKELCKLMVSATAMALVVGLSGCAGMRSPGTADRSMVHASGAAGECRTTSATALSSDAPPKLERTARAAAGAVKGALLGAVGGAGAVLWFAVAYAPACVDPMTCGSGLGALVTIGAVAGGVIGAVEGARTAWRESSGVARNFLACNTEPETRTSGNSSSGEAELPHGSRTET